jgi:hypothetical protein
VAIFIDRHLVVEIDPAIRNQMHVEALEGRRDPTGTLPLGHWVEDGTIYCVVDAPDAEAVCRHHQDRGIGCNELHPVDGLTGGFPLTGSDRALVVAEIKRLWHAPAHL